MEFHVKDGQDPVDAYKERVAEMVRDYHHGCPEGKADFLRYIGIHTAETPYQVTASVILGVPASAHNEDGYLYVPSKRGVGQGYGASKRSVGQGDLVAVRNLLYLALVNPEGDSLLRDAGIQVNDTMVKRVA